MNVNNNFGVIGESYTYEGITFDSQIPKDLLMKVIHEFEFRKDDVFVATYPKSGTTWMQEILFLLHNGVDLEKAKTVDKKHKVPFLEFYSEEDKDNLDLLNGRPSPRLIKTHLKSDMVQRAIDVGAKFVVVLRNPKDMLVSYYHHYKLINLYKGSWNDYFELFKMDKILWGNWFDHVFSWWKYKDSENVFFVKYEDMKENPKQELERVTHFLQFSVSEEKMDAILNHTAFKNMKSLPSCTYSCPEFNTENGTLGFIRKGEVGDWKNFFTIAQNEYFDHLYAEKMKNCDLVFRFTI